MKRALGTLQIRSANEELRELSGVATTGRVDRVGDIVDPLGATFASSGVPLLMSHDASAPVGRVKFGTPTAAGIPFTAKIARISEPGTLQDRTDEAWQLAKYGIVDAVSIGFRVLDNAIERLQGGGLKFLKTEIMELSLVSVPANPDARILETRTARDRHHVVKLKPATARREDVIVKLSEKDRRIGKMVAEAEARHAARRRSGEPLPVVRITAEARQRAERLEQAKAELEARRRRWLGL